MFDFLTKYILGTPDFGHSDLWHQSFSFASKFSQALKSGYFPFWVKDIGMGFPMLADGEMGMFFPPNFIFLRIFDPILALNLLYIVVYLTLIFGSYLFARAIKLSRSTAIFFAVIFSFSGLIVTQLRSIRISQVMSFMPLEFYFVEKFIQTKKYRYLFFYSLSITLQIFANYQQMVMISLIGVGLYAFGRIIMERKYKLVIGFILFSLLGFFMALPQLIPTYQLTSLSFRNTGAQLSIISQYPYPIKNLLSLLNPYFWGDPRIGTYAPFSANWGIFWENTGYIGILPLILAGYSLKLKNRAFLKTLGVMLGISFVLLLGKATPLFFLYQLPPLNMFRVPSRFLLLFVWTLVILASMSLDQIKNMKIKVFLIIIAFADLFFFSFNYHTFINASEWLKPPETVKILSQDKSWYRVYSPVPVVEWNNIFYKGWQDIEKYKDFRNCLDANQNLLWDIPSADSYAGLYSRRQELWQMALQSGTLLDENQKRLTVSSSSAKFLSLSGVKYLISPYTTPDLELMATVSGSPNFYIYQNPNFLPHTYLTKNYVVVKTVPELYAKVSDPKNSATVIEESLPFESSPITSGSAQVVLNSDLEVTINVNSPEEQLLVLSDTYYPKWGAFINGKQYPIIPVNLNQRGVVVPEGKYSVIFKYNQFSFSESLAK